MYLKLNDLINALSIVKKIGINVSKTTRSNKSDKANEFIKLITLFS